MIDILLLLKFHTTQKNEPIEIPMDYANEFKDLGERVKHFREDFDRYLEEQGQQLTARVIELQEKIKIAEDTARQCVLPLRLFGHHIDRVEFFYLRCDEIVCDSARYQLAIILTNNRFARRLNMSDSSLFLE